MWCLLLLTFCESSVLESDSCLSILLTEPSFASLTSILKFSGRGINEVGKYNECLRQKNIYYLLSELEESSEVSISIGICLPIECNITGLNTYLRSQNLKLKQQTPSSFTTLSIFFLIFLSLICLITIFSTVLHYTSEKFLNYSIVSCFSAILTLRGLMKLRENNKLGCLNGLKVLSFGWVIYGHCFVLKLSSSLINLERLQDIYYHWWGVLGYGGFFAVDIFFFVTGLLSSYFLLIELAKRQGRLKWGLMYLHRLLRILPSYLVMIGLCVLVFPHIGSGPVWQNFEKFVSADCHQYWWTNLLFINNFVPDYYGNYCFGIGWYLANDMQFFFVGPLLVYFYFKIRSKKLFWACFYTLVAICIFIGYYVAYDLNLRVNVNDPNNHDEDDNNIWFLLYYIKPYTRIVVYLQGISVGISFYYYDKIVNKFESEIEIGKESYGKKSEIGMKDYNEINDKLSEKIVKFVLEGHWRNSFLMAAGCALMYGCVIVQQEVYDDIYNTEIWSRNTNAIVIGLHRFLFILGLTLFIFPVLLNKSKFFNTILGNSAFEPISKISYCGFLVHFAILIGYHSSQHNSLLDGIYFFREWFTFMPLVLMAALLLYITIEVPFQNLERKLVR